MSVTNQCRLRYFALINFLPAQAANLGIGFKKKRTNGQAIIIVAYYIPGVTLSVSQISCH